MLRVKERLVAWNQCLVMVYGQWCAAHGGGPKLISKAPASPCPRRHVFSFPGAASNFGASGEYNRKRGRHHDQSSLGGTSPRTLHNIFWPWRMPAARITTHTVLCRHAGWQNLGAPEEVLSCSSATVSGLCSAELPNKSPGCGAQGLVLLEG